MTHTKERLTISLSREAIKILKAIKAQAKSPSMSALIESIVADLKSRNEIEQLSVQTSAYYDSLSPAQISDDAAWGALGESALAQDGVENEERPQLAHAER